MPYYLKLLINPVLKFIGISSEVLEPGERKFSWKKFSWKDGPGTGLSKNNK
jgi:hypothetical protein